MQQSKVTEKRIILFILNLWLHIVYLAHFDIRVASFNVERLYQIETT